MKNTYRIENEIVYIKLNRKDGTVLETLIDMTDLELVSSITGSWISFYCKETKSYYCSTHVHQDGKRKTLYLHRFIMGLLDSKLQVDHKHHNTLDNRRSQLKVVTPQENQWNYSGKGYYYNKRDKKFIAQISVSKKVIYLGSFITEKEAREAYLKAKEIYHRVAT